MGENETKRAWEEYLGLGLKIPCSLRVVMRGGVEGRIGEEEEWIGLEGGRDVVGMDIGPREARPGERDAGLSWPGKLIWAWPSRGRRQVWYGGEGMAGGWGARLGYRM